MHQSRVGLQDIWPPPWRPEFTEKLLGLPVMGFLAAA